MLVNFNFKLGKQLRNKRKELGLTVKEVAKKIGCNSTYSIYSCENGYGSKSALEKYSKFLGEQELVKYLQR